MWIVEHSDGDVSQHHEEPGTAGIDPGVRHSETPRELDLARERWDWDAGEIVPLLEVVRAELLARIDAERAARLGAPLTQGPEVQYAYVQKAAELYNYDVLIADQVPEMTPEQLASTFPWIAAEADLLGISLADAMARVRAARAAADAQLRAIEAKAQAAKVAIRAATTLEDMQTAAAVDWEI